MSLFSGKCDLYDHIRIDGGDLDEYEAFEKFKRKTGGKIYQTIKLELTKYNIDAEIARFPEKLSKIEHKKIVKDARRKSGEREVITYTYKYLFREFASLKDLNNFGYWTQREISFDDILDIIPYYPYIIAVCGSDQEHTFIQIANKSYYDVLEIDALNSGNYEARKEFCDRYRNLLKMHYIEVVKDLDNKKNYKE